VVFVGSEGSEGVKVSVLPLHPMVPGSEDAPSITRKLLAGRWAQSMLAEKVAVTVETVEASTGSAPTGGLTWTTWKEVEAAVTVSSAPSLTTAPPGFQTTTLNVVPESATVVAGVAYVAEVAPGMLTPFRSHW